MRQNNSPESTSWLCLFQIFISFLVYFLLGLISGPSFPMPASNDRHFLLTIPFSSCLLARPLTWTHHFTHCLAKQIIPTPQGNPRTSEFSKVGLRWLNFSHSWTTHSHNDRQCMAVVECRLCSLASGVWTPALHSLHVLGEFFASPCFSFLI